MKCLEIVKFEQHNFSWIFSTLLSRERKSQKSCNFQPPSIILSHHNEREGNSSYCLYNRCQRAGKRKSAEKFHKTILNLCLLSLFNKLNLLDELFFWLLVLVKCQVCEESQGKSWENFVLKANKFDGFPIGSVSRCLLRMLSKFLSWILIRTKRFPPQICITDTYNIVPQ